MIQMRMRTTRRSKQIWMPWKRPCRSRSSLMRHLYPLRRDSLVARPTVTIKACAFLSARGSLAVVRRASLALAVKYHVRTVNERMSPSIHPFVVHQESAIATRAVCSDLPCLNGATCVDTFPNTFTCLCTPDWTDDLCSTPRNIVFACRQETLAGHSFSYDCNGHCCDYDGGCDHEHNLESNVFDQSLSQWSIVHHRSGRRVQLRLCSWLYGSSL